MKKDIKYIKIGLCIDEFNRIYEDAKGQKVSLQHFAKTKLLDDLGGRQELRDKIARKIPEYLFLAEQVDDDELREGLKDLGGAVCQLLR